MEETSLFDRKGRRKYLNETEREAFIAAARKEEDLLQRSLCLVLAYTGCRISEALGLTRERVDRQESAIIFESLKKRKRGVYRVVPISRKLLRTLEESHALTLIDQPEAALWPYSRSTAYRIVKRIMNKMGLKGVSSSPKGLRHGFGIACAQKNVPLPTIQKWMGHADISTTAIYLNALGEEEREFARRIWD